MPSDKAQQGVAPIAAKIQRPTHTWRRAQKVGHHKHFLQINFQYYKESLMTTLQEQIAVMQHFANGGEVECKTTHGTIWSKTTHPLWNWPTGDYRIAQPPKQKMWQWIMNSDDAFWITSRFYPNKDEVQSNFGTCTVIKSASWTEIEV